MAMVPWKKKHYHPIVIRKWPSSKSNGITYTAHDICNFVTSERISEHSVQTPSPCADLNHIFTVTDTTHHGTSADNQLSSQSSEADDESEEEQVVQQYDNEDEEGGEKAYYEGQYPEPDDPPDDPSLLFRCKAKLVGAQPCVAPWFELEQEVLEHLHREHNTSKRLYDVFSICPQR